MFCSYVLHRDLMKFHYCNLQYKAQYKYKRLHVVGTNSLLSRLRRFYTPPKKHPEDDPVHCGRYLLILFVDELFFVFSTLASKM